MYLLLKCDVRSLYITGDINVLILVILLTFSHFSHFQQAKDEGRFAVFGQIKEDCCFDDFELVKHDVYFLMFMQVEIIYDIIYA